MPYSVEFENLPAGYAAAAARGEGVTVPVLAREFVSSEDGDTLVGRLEGLPSQILAMLPAEAKAAPSSVDHLLAIIRRDKTATVYLNELPIVARALAKRSIQAGAMVGADDIADVVEVAFGDVKVPRSAGVVVVFSAGWRKGLFYDLTPLQANGARARDFDFDRALGAYYSYLWFNHLFKISASDWQALFAAGWFPFQGLSQGTAQKLLSHVRQGWSTDELVAAVANDVKANLPILIERCEASEVLRKHLEFVRSASDALVRADFIGASSVLYPRIEGVMRDLHRLSGNDAKPAHQNLVASLIQIGSDQRHPYSLLLPEMFQRFLKEVYFRDFNPRDTGLSRHSVAHGVAPGSAFSEQGALLGFLILNQVSLFSAALQSSAAKEDSCAP